MTGPAALVAMTADQLLDLAVRLMPGALAALIVLVLVFVGFQIGRRVPRRSVRRIESALRDLQRGEYSGAPDVDPNDPAAGIASAIESLSGSLRERSRGLEHRSVVVGEAFEQVAGRGIFVTDRELRIVTAGEGLARMAGVAAEKLEGRPAGSLFSEASWKELLVDVVDADKRFRGITGTLELVLENDVLPLNVLAADTSLPTEGIAFLVEAQPSLDPGDESGASSMRLGLDQLAALFDGLADGLLVVIDGRISTANPTARSWLGEAGAGEYLRDFVAAEDLLMVVERIARAERGEKVDPFKCRLAPRRPGFPSRQVEVHTVTVQIRDRQAAVLTARDLGTDLRRRRRGDLQRARLMSVVDAAADGIMMFEAPLRGDSDWRVSLLNERARSLLGLTRPLAIGSAEEKFRSAVAHRFKDMPALVSFLDRSRSEPNKEWAGAFEMNAKPARTVELVVRPVAGAEGVIFGRVLVVRDVTRHREIERQLRGDARALEKSRESLQTAYEELSALTRSMERKAGELDEVNSELRQVDRSRAQLISGVSHELQTPLVSIRGYTQMVLEGRLGRINDEQRQGLEKVLRNVDRMVGLIENLLGMSRAEETPELLPEAISPEPLIKEIIERHQAVADEKRVRIELRANQPGLLLFAEREGLIQVLDNLIGNAIKFNRERGAVTVILEAGPAGYATLHITDTGIGIPSDEQRRVFERFFRGKGAAGVPGSGIGLATVQAIVNRHGGKIEFASTPGRGTTFRVAWPLQASQDRSSPATKS